jgi:AraC-like DNA-binding protein
VVRLSENGKHVQNSFNEKTDAELAGSVSEAGFFIRALQKAALDCVMKGDINGISRVIKAYVFVGANSEVAIPLRSRKNRFIALCALACERAVTAGLDENTVNDTWENYSKLCDDCLMAENVNALTIKLLLELTAKVKKSSEKMLSASAEKVKGYVASHLYERITVAEVAENLGLSASYLNSSFKQQTGSCITDYIQMKKIEEAKTLLSAGADSIADIWTNLGYYDQSHFSRIFKKHTGFTPKQFRVINHDSGKGKTNS